MVVHRYIYRIYRTAHSEKERKKIYNKLRKYINKDCAEIISKYAESLENYGEEDYYLG